MLRRLIAVGLVIAGTALPVYAQRGGGGRGGSGGHGDFSGGGFASHSAPAFRGDATSFRGSFVPAGRGSFATTPQYRGTRMVSPVPAFRGDPGRNGTGVWRPVYPGGGADRYRRPYLPYYATGGPYVVGWIGPDYLDYTSDYYPNANPDSGVYDNSSYPAAPPPTGGYETPPEEQVQGAPAKDSFRVPYQRPEPEPAGDITVTLVFKDGRPNEQIHNYLLTRTTLYVREDRLREIAVADLDLMATEKLNREAGVDFSLPDSK